MWNHLGVLDIRGDDGGWDSFPCWVNLGCFLFEASISIDGEFSWGFTYYHLFVGGRFMKIPMLEIFLYPLVNCYITIENHHFQWENSLFLWPFSIAFCIVYQRVLLLGLVDEPPRSSKIHVSRVGNRLIPKFRTCPSWWLGKSTPATLKFREQKIKLFDTWFSNSTIRWSSCLAYMICGFLNCLKKSSVKCARETILKGREQCSKPMFGRLWLIITCLIYIYTHIWSYTLQYIRDIRWYISLNGFDWRSWGHHCVGSWR